MSRQIVLRLMLVILGIAAALAIYSIFQSSETSWRIVGTAFTLAVTIGLIVPFVPADAGQRVDLLQRTVIGHWTLGGGLVIIFAAVIMNLQVYFAATSLFSAILMFGMLVGGLGLIARSLRAHL